MLHERDLAGIRLRVTARSGDHFESALAEAAARGRNAAATRTADRLGGLDVVALGQNIDCKAPLLLDVASSFLAELDAEATIDRCIRTMDARPGSSRLADGTRRPVIPEFADVYPSAHGEAAVTSMRGFAVQDLTTRGITLVVNNLVPRTGGALRDLTNDLSRSLGVSAQVNLYLSERDAPGFGRHWDDHDVLIIQTVGRKHWTLFAPTALSPRIGVTPTREFGSSVFSTILEPGAALYIPRGWGHEVRGFENELSMHYTVGMRLLTGNDVLEACRGSRSPEDLARLVTTASARDPSLQIDRGLLEHAVGDHRMAFTTTPVNGVVEIHKAVQSAFMGKAFTAPLPGGAIFADMPATPPDARVICAGGYAFEAEPEALDLLVDLFAGQAVAAGCSGGSTRQASLLLLARRGIVDMVDAPVGSLPSDEGALSDNLA